MPTARPGRFARAAVAGLSTGAERLYETHRSFVDDIVAGRPLQTDPQLRFLMGVTPSAEQTYVGGGHRGRFVQIALNPAGPAEVVESKPTLSALIHFPPFSLLLVDPEFADEYPHVDCTHWLALGVQETVPDFPFAFPGVTIVGSTVATAANFAATTV